MSTSSGSPCVVLGCTGASFGIPPPSPVILFRRAEPPARILASRRSLRMRACSAALEGGVLGEEDGAGGVSAMLGCLG